MRRIIIFYFLLTLLPQASKSQSPFFKQVNLNRENPSQRITKLIVDSNGFLYAGTSDGLYKSDGIDEQQFIPEGKKKIEISALKEFHQQIYVGYSDGSIYILNESEFKPLTAKPLSASTINDFIFLKDQTLLIATAGEGIISIKGNKITHFTSTNGLNDDYVYCFANIGNNKIIAGTDQGIALLDVSNGIKLIKKITTDNLLPDDICRSLVFTKNNQVLIGFQEKGFAIADIDFKTILIPKISQNWNYGQINTILNYKNDVWVATQKNGLVYVNLNDTTTAENYTSYGTDNFTNINDLVFDHEGNIWLSNNNELIRTHGRYLMFMDHYKQEKLNMIHTIFCDSKGNVWFTPDEQLVVYNPTADSSNQFQKFQITEISNHINITCFYEDKYGWVWIGTLGEGLYRFNLATHKKQKITGNNKLEHSSVLDIKGNNNTIWVATYGGVIRSIIPDDQTSTELQLNFEDISSVPELGNFYINTIFIDSKKRVWFGSDGRGLTVYETHKFVNITDSLKANIKTIYSIAEDTNGNIWFSTLNKGVYKYDGKILTSYSTDNGLRENTITAIAADKSGKIIFIHKRGIDVLTTSTNSFEYYGADNNLINLSADINSISKSNSGNYWIGTEKGIVVFNPDYNHTQTGAQVVLNKVAVNNKLVSLTQKGSFNYDQNTISFSYSGIWFTDPSRIKFQYKLEGFTKDWIQTKDKTITFSNLPDGNYTFKIRTSLNNNFEGSKEYTYSFVIKKAFWTTLWFKILSLLLFVLAAWLYLKSRDKQIRKVQELENEKVDFQLQTLKSQVNPHFLFNSFNTLISIIEKDKDESVEYVEKLSDFFRNMVNFRDTNLITLGEEIQLLDAYLYLQRKRYKEHLNMLINLSNDDKLNYCVAPLSLQMLVENAIKHNAVSKETPLTINLRIIGEGLCVSNNINKKFQKETSSGMGLQNISKRYKLLSEHQVLITSDEHVFSVTIPLIICKK